MSYSLKWKEINIVTNATYEGYVCGGDFCNTQSISSILYPSVCTAFVSILSVPQHHLLSPDQNTLMPTLPESEVNTGGSKRETRQHIWCTNRHLPCTWLQHVIRRYKTTQEQKKLKSNSNHPPIFHIYMEIDFDSWSDQRNFNCTKFKQRSIEKLICWGGQHRCLILIGFILADSNPLKYAQISLWKLLHTIL